MAVFEGRLFRKKVSAPWRRKASNLELRGCQLYYCESYRTSWRWAMTRISNVGLFDCEFNGCRIESAIVEDVTVDGLKTGSEFWVANSMFKHVALKGRIGRIIVQHTPSLFSGLRAARRFENAMRDYYSSVDWAIDVSQAEFSRFKVTGVPARLIRRDPATSAVVTYEKASKVDLNALGVESLFHEYLRGMLREKAPDIVLVAPKRSRTFKTCCDDLRRLREAGVAEPD